MSIRSLAYDNDKLDVIICCFMRTILHIQKTGIANLPLENDLEEPFKGFMETAVKLLTEGTPPEISRIILESEYDITLMQKSVTIDTVVGLQLIKEIAWHIHFDEDYYGYLLSTENLWGNRALTYASLTFYPNLPAAVKEKYGIYDLIKYVPQDRLQLDDY